MKIIVHIIRKIGIGIVLFISIYFLAAFILSRISVAKEKNTKEEIFIYVKSNGVHTDIVMPARNEQMDWTREIKFSNTQTTDTTWRYVAMGWGDKGFYLQTPKWKDLKLSVACKAAFALSTTAIHATYYRDLTLDKKCKKIGISKEQYARLIQYMVASFQQDEAGHFMAIKTNANYGNTDAFYEAKGSYSLLYTCNTWANNALKSCGQTCCVWTIFDTGIFLKYE